jgi:hypothetical protein
MLVFDDERGYGASTDRVLAHSSASSIAGASAGAGLAAASASMRKPTPAVRRRETLFASGGRCGGAREARVGSATRPL